MVNGELGVGMTTHVCHCEKVAEQPPEAISDMVNQRVMLLNL